VYVIVWQFEPQAGKEADFERAYSTDGDWALLFERSPEYRGTELLRPVQGRVYLTVDRWTSGAAFGAFQARWRAEYEALDRRCEALTERETLVGRFEAV
jgi:heme-degrading monooxygenase HmoA